MFVCLLLSNLLQLLLVLTCYYFEYGTGVFKLYGHPKITAMNTPTHLLVSRNCSDAMDSVSWCYGLQLKPYSFVCILYLFAFWQVGPIKGMPI